MRPTAHARDAQHWAAPQCRSTCLRCAVVQIRVAVLFPRPRWRGPDPLRGPLVLIETLQKGTGHWGLKKGERDTVLAFARKHCSSLCRLQHLHASNHPHADARCLHTQAPSVEAANLPITLRSAGGRASVLRGVSQKRSSSFSGTAWLAGARAIFSLRRGWVEELVRAYSRGRAHTQMVRNALDPLMEHLTAVFRVQMCTLRTNVCLRARTRARWLRASIRIRVRGLECTRKSRPNGALVKRSAFPHSRPCPLALTLLRPRL